MAMWLVYSA